MYSLIAIFALQIWSLLKREIVVQPRENKHIAVLLSLLT